MTRLLSRTIVGLLAGALGGAVALAVVYARNPSISMEMDRDPAPIAGLYEVERAGQETFAWTRRDATLALPGLDRRIPWSCTIRVRGGRAEVSTLPEVLLSVDGVIEVTRATTNEYQDVTFALPPRHSSGATVTVTASNTFQPGPSDTRSLGVMVDRWTCAPAGSALIRPPQQALWAAAAAGAAFGVALALLGLGLLAVAAASVAIGLAQALPISWELGMFTRYAALVPWLAFWIALALAAGVRGVEWITRRPQHAAARFVAIFTAASLYLKLLALLHPSKTIVDAVFHAHRLMWVLDGRFFFTQPMPGGVQFPYAIGLYVFAAPWSLLTNDYVLLLRIIVSAAEASGCLLLYLLVSRAWGDPLAGAIAAVLFSVVPRAFEIVGNANMTNAFGQSVALATVAAAVLWRLGRHDWWQRACLTALTSFALLCHISTLTLLGAILVALAALYWWRGKPDLREPAVSVLLALIVAAVFSVAMYYGHFGEAYRTAARVRASAAPAAVIPAQPDTSMRLAPRIIEAARLSVAAVGWPMILLASIGAVSRWRSGLRDRLSLAVAAWMVTYFVFVASVVIAPVGTSFLRYAAEFITRVTLATCPAIVVLAALGSAGGLRRGWAWRVPVAALLIFTCYTGVQLWLDWLR